MTVLQESPRSCQRASLGEVGAREGRGAYLSNALECDGITDDGSMSRVGYTTGQIIRDRSPMASVSTIERGQTASRLVTCSRYWQDPNFVRRVLAG